MNEWRSKREKSISSTKFPTNCSAMNFLFNLNESKICSKVLKELPSKQKTNVFKSCFLIEAEIILHNDVCKFSKWCKILATRIDGQTNECECTCCSENFHPPNCNKSGIEIVRSIRICIECINWKSLRNFGALETPTREWLRACERKIQISIVFTCRTSDFQEWFFGNNP